MNRLILLCLILVTQPCWSQEMSHPPLRREPAPSKRPMDKGPGYFVDARNGQDRNPGTQAAPWKTLEHAVRQLKAGDTLYLREGTYYERLYLALAGKPDAPITIRAFPGERAVVDAGLREFFEAPADVWEPVGSGGEFRSKQRYPNLRDIVGSFGDSMIGLQTYHHAIDLRATNDLIDYEDWNQAKTADIKPLYLGPGIWYDRDTGYIHARFSHTHLPKPVPNYQGPQDPRKLPLVLAPFAAIVVHFDQAKHVRLQDLVLRGAGYQTIRMDQADHCQLDNLTVWCGTYGLTTIGVTNLRVHQCGFHGSVAPWTFRADASKRDYPGRPHRNLSRLNTHALIEIDNGGESSVYATPQNDFWDIAHCEFVDAHDGVYLGGINGRFHNNLIENLQDDAIYLSPMYFRHRLDKKDPQVVIDQNVIRQVLTAFAFGGPESETRDQVFILRNIVDLRQPVPTARPSTKKAEPSYSLGHLIGDHGSPPWSAMQIYHNTFIQGDTSRYAAMATLGSTKSAHPRGVFNNIFYHLEKTPIYAGPDPASKVIEDGNLYWSPKMDVKFADLFFQKYRASKLFAQSKETYAPGFGTNSRFATPGFEVTATGPLDARLTKGSAAVDAGIDVAKDLPDPLRERDAGRPDIGALPLGVERLEAGRKKD